MPEDKYTKDIDFFMFELKKDFSKIVECLKDIIQKKEQIEEKLNEVEIKLAHMLRDAF